MTDLNVREKICESCGARFDCCAGNCWCEEMPLQDGARRRLQDQYGDCLCAACLRRLAGAPAETLDRDG